MMKVIMWPRDRAAQEVLITHCLHLGIGVLGAFPAFPIHPFHERRVLDHMSMTRGSDEVLLVTASPNALSWCWANRLSRDIEVFVWHQVEGRWGAVPVIEIKNEEYLNQMDLGELYANCDFEEPVG